MNVRRTPATNIPQRPQEGSNMTATIESIATVRTRRPAIGTLRLRLKPAHQACGFVQGAWWPRSTLLTVELPSLLAALSLRFGRIDRVQYRETDWSQAPQHIKHQGAGIVLDSSQDSPNIISVSGQQFGKLTLLVVPPYTDATHAYDVVMTAASALDSSTPDQLLGNRTQGPTDPLHAPIALQRWESDGGAVQLAPQSLTHMQV
jgi:hypothetical protein